MGREKIVTVPNPDKEGHHQDARRPGLYPPHPARIMFSGRSGCGKGVAAKNLLACASPPFERIVVWHFDIGTLEWGDCEPSGVIAELPDDPSQFWDRDQKHLIICDEIPWEQLSKADGLKSRLADVVRFFSLQYGRLHPSSEFRQHPHANTPCRRLVESLG